MTDKKVIAIFAWSQEISNTHLNESIKEELRKFLIDNKNKIEKIIYWWSTHWVMWIVFQVCQEVGITIEWYSIERYRKYDEWNWVNILFFKDDEERIWKFTENWDMFLALPWWLWTIKEILSAKDYILESKSQKHIYVSSLFTTFYTLLNNLIEQWMIYWKDKDTIINALSLNDIKV